MKPFREFIHLFVLLQIFATQNVTSYNTFNPFDNMKSNTANGRRNGFFIIDNMVKSPDGRHITQKVETKTYQVSNDESSFGDLHGWISKMNGGNTIIQPYVVHSNQSYGIGDSNGQVLQKLSTIETSDTITGGGLLDLLHNLQNNQWQSGHKAVKEGSLATGKYGKESSKPITSNYANDLTRTSVTRDEGINTYDGLDNIQKENNLFYPEHDSYISIVNSNNGIYAKEFTEKPLQNPNIKVVSESNSPNIVALPVMRPQFGRYVIYGYRPNIKYYLSQETSNILNNPSSMSRVPSFLEHSKPNHIDQINLSEDQLNNYKQYLIQSGLMKLKPYQLIFSDQFRPKLRSLNWMVVPLKWDLEYCKRYCSGIFPRSTLYSTISENASKLPLKLLVPVLKVRSGLKKSATGLQTIAGGVGDITSGIYRMAKDAPSHIFGLVKANADDVKNETLSN